MALRSPWRLLPLRAPFFLKQKKYIHTSGSFESMMMCVLQWGLYKAQVGKKCKQSLLSYPYIHCLTSLVFITKSSTFLWLSLCRLLPFLLLMAASYNQNIIKRVSNVYASLDSRCTGAYIYFDEVNTNFIINVEKKSFEKSKFM